MVQTKAIARPKDLFTNRPCRKWKCDGIHRGCEYDSATHTFGRQDRPSYKHCEEPLADCVCIAAEKKENQRQQKAQAARKAARKKADDKKRASVKLQASVVARLAAIEKVLFGKSKRATAPAGVDEMKSLLGCNTHAAAAIRNRLRTCLLTHYDQLFTAIAMRDQLIITAFLVR